jgi:hypothetical protein
MKVLYIASNAIGSSTLRIEQDITELQRVASQVSGDPVNFVFLPALPFEDIELYVAALKPDIVHISAHGGPNELWLSNSAESKVRLTSESLRAVLAGNVPRLIYINACTSSKIAKSLAGFVAHAIGTSADITNFAARKSAVTFYRCLLRGQSLQVAFNASSATVKTLSEENAVETRLFSKAGSEASRSFFYRLPRLMAYFEDHIFSKHEGGGYNFALGIAGASDNTSQVTICTDDESFVENDTDDPKILQGLSLETKLSEIVRTNAINGEVWSKGVWPDIEGDFRLFALGITASGESYSIAGTLCEALVNFYAIYFDSPDGSAFPEDLKAALIYLRENDGSLLRSRKNEAALTPMADLRRKPRPRHGRE